MKIDSISLLFLLLGSPAFASGPDCWGGETYYEPNKEIKVSGKFRGEFSCHIVYEGLDRTSYTGGAHQSSYLSPIATAQKLSGCQPIEYLSTLQHSEFKDGFPVNVDIHFSNKYRLNTDCSPEMVGRACSFSFHFLRSSLTFESEISDFGVNDTEFQCQKILDSYRLWN